MMMLARFWRKMVEIRQVGAEILVPALEARSGLVFEAFAQENRAFTVVYPNLASRYPRPER